MSLSGSTPLWITSMIVPADGFVVVVHTVGDGDKPVPKWRKAFEIPWGEDQGVRRKAFDPEHRPTGERRLNLAAGHFGPRRGQPPAQGRQNLRHGQRPLFGPPDGEPRQMQVKGGGVRHGEMAGFIGESQRTVLD
jgi:hypothetical protein